MAFSFVESMRRRFGAGRPTSRPVSLASQPDFLLALTSEVAANLDNHFGAENWDPERFGPYEAAPHPSGNTTLQEALSRLEPAAERLQQSYDLLSDNYSKSMFVKVLPTGCWGRRKYACR